MKIIFTFIIVATLGLFRFGANAQTNLIDLWDGNGATGAGTEPNVFGWAGSNVTSGWGIANAAGSIRLQDITASNNYTYNGAQWTGRVFFLRWDGVGGSNTTTVWSYPVTLEASKSYIFSGRIGWNSNGSANIYTISINSAANNTGTFLASGTLSVPSTLKLLDDTLIFSPVTSGTYYLTFKNTTAILGAVADLSIVETTDACIGEINTQYNALDLGNLSDVQSNLTLPSGTGSVTISWESSNTAVISNTGAVTQPSKFNATVVLTATLSANCSGTLYKKTKTFTATVTAKNPASELLAQWDFNTSDITLDGDTIKVKDISGSNFIGKLTNDAKIRTIGTSKKINVLDLGNNKGYFNMGKEIGEAIYSLSNYTICGYFRVDTSYKYLNSNGNFLWTFSNSDDQPTYKNGYIIGSLKAQGQSITTNYYDNGNQAVQVGTPAAQGAWHHMAYTQEGDSGRVFIDGVIVKRGLVTNKPSTALPKAGLTGTPFNWIGRSNYPGDVYLRKTLVYDFRLLGIPLTADDMQAYLGVTDTLAILNTAYAQDSSYIPSSLADEMAALTLGDLSGVTVPNITLPTVGTIDPTIKIIWKTNRPQVITNTGVVTRPDYYDMNVTLTAVLFKDGKTVTKTFPATVLVKPGTPFTNDLIAEFDFSHANVSGANVTDIAEKHFTGTMMNQASIRTIGNVGNQYDVLDLGNGTGYFDMGQEMGKVLYHLTDFTIGAYFLIDTSYTQLASNGNFLWSLSNSDKVLSEKNGYILGSLKAQGADITATDYNTAQSVVNPNASTNIIKDSRWHHIAYTLESTSSTGTLYIDGLPLATSSTISLTPFAALTIDNRIGTLYNWLGRSCYAGDAYLRKTLVYDFRLYKKALNPIEIGTVTGIDVPNTIISLNNAYIANPNLPTSVNLVKNIPYKVFSTGGQIRIEGLSGKDKVSLFDLTGRQLRVIYPSAITVKHGIYILKINNYTKKVVVQ